MMNDLDMPIWDYEYEYPTSLNGCVLKRTCLACPEQYDVFKGDIQIGYLRLRHGRFTAEYPDCGENLVYEASPRGDGAFMDDERIEYLTAAVNALLDAYREFALPALFYERKDY